LPFLPISKDFPGGNARDLFRSIRETLFSLPSNTRLFVGHDYQPDGRQLQFETTVAEERASNKHVALEVSEEEFVKMRSERDKSLGNPRLLYPSLQVCNFFCNYN
jgi:glyoxylase-like metal-dependent hydrolase (beta-lactamase superfamily II)